MTMATMPTVMLKSVYTPSYADCECRYCTAGGTFLHVDMERSGIPEGLLT